MNSQRGPVNMEQLLDLMGEVGQEKPRLSIAEMLDSVGRRSFGPLVLLVGLLLVTPLSGIPGMPTTMGLLMLLTLGQIFLGRQSFWLPAWLVRREIRRERLLRGLQLIRPAARRIDRLIRPRILVLVSGPGFYVMALACMVIAFVMPATELVPFSSSLAGLALVGFGLAMISRDGLLALMAWCLVLSGPVMVVENLA